MTKLYKLTDENGKTRAGKENELQWGEGVTHTAQGTSLLLDFNGVIHAYEHPFISVFMNTIHAKFATPRLWEAEGTIVAREGQLKCGVKTLTTVREIPVPIISTTHCVRVAINCALEVYDKSTAFCRWAQKWRSGEDRSEEAARTATTSAHMDLVFTQEAYALLQNKQAVKAMDELYYAARSGFATARAACEHALASPKAKAWSATAAHEAATARAIQAGPELDLLALLQQG